MSYVVNEITNECSKYCEKWEEFYQSTPTFLKAIRRVCHGIRLEHRKMKAKNVPTVLYQRVIDRHEIACQKIMSGLHDYSHNFLSVRNEYNELQLSTSKLTLCQKAKLEEKYVEVCVQRDIIFHGIFTLVEIHLKIIGSNFMPNQTKLHLDYIFKVIETYNKYLVRLQHNPIPLTDDDSSINMCTQFIPETLRTFSSKLKRFTASRILQIIGDSRANKVTKVVAETLLSRFETTEENGTPLPWKVPAIPRLNQVTHVDIFEEAIAKEEDENKCNQRKLDMALRLEFGDDFPGTAYLHSTENAMLVAPVECNAIDELVDTNAKLMELLLTKFIHTTGVIVSVMLKRNKNGKLQLLKGAKARLESYFVEKMWGTGTESVEEILVWQPLPNRPLMLPAPALFSPIKLFNLIKIFKQLCDRNAIPESCEASCQCLIEEVRHVAVTSYMDVYLIKGFGPYSSFDVGVHKLDDGNFCTKGGEGLSLLTEMLVWHVNDIEKTEVEKEGKDWPLAEEICFLLCLGTLISSFLSWARIRASHLLNTWNTAPFFLVSQADLPNVIFQLKKLKIQERDNLVKTDDIGRLQFVAQREKSVKMMENLLEFIQAYEEEVVENVSSVCRTVCLAQLQNSMPNSRVWKGVGRIPHEPHQFVYDYIGAVLEKVLNAVAMLGVALQKRAGSMVLKVVCYAWLDHIKAQRIKFSLWGAQQLLKDFHALAEWLKSFPGLDAEARSQILAVDVLRECEGVARLLMRQPPLVIGYSNQNQVAPLVPIAAGRKRDKELKLGSEDDGIPAEMYVPNQQLWLNLRARPNSAYLVRLATCCSWPY